MAFGRYNNLFNNQEQHDTHEFLLSFLNLLNNLLDNTIISNFFDLEMRTTRKCVSCNHVSVSTEKSTCLSLPVHGHENFGLIVSILFFIFFLNFKTIT